MSQNKKAALIFRIGSFFFALAGILATTGVFDGQFRAGSLAYYTIMSNLLALALFGLLSYKTIKAFKRQGSGGNVAFYPVFEMICVVDLLLTLLVYWVLLAPQAFNMGDGSSLWSFSNLAVHLVTPLLCLLDYVLFTTPGYLKYKQVYGVLIFPLAYVLFSTIMGLSGYVYRIGTNGAPERFPYFFLNWYVLGPKVLVYIAALAGLLLFLGHLFYAYDKRRKKLLL